MPYAGLHAVCVPLAGSRETAPRQDTLRTFECAPNGERPALRIEPVALLPMCPCGDFLGAAMRWQSHRTDRSLPAEPEECAGMLLIQLSRFRPAAHCLNQAYNHHLTSCHRQSRTPVDNITLMLYVFRASVIADPYPPSLRAPQPPAAFDRLSAPEPLAVPLPDNKTRSYSPRYNRLLFAPQATSLSPRRWPPSRCPAPLTHYLTPCRPPSWTAAS